MNEQVRGWVYLVSAIILIGLVIAGVVGDDEVDRYLAIVATALGGGNAALAAANTSRKPQE